MTADQSAYPSVKVSELKVESTTPSTSPTTGSAVFNGGVGVQGNLSVGGSITGGSITYAATSTGNLVVTDSPGTSFQVLSTEQSTDLNTGAAVFNGGVAVKGNMRVGGTLTAGDISYSSTNTDTLSVNNVTGQTLAVLSTQDASTVTDGAVRIDGGASVAKNIKAGGEISSSSVSTTGRISTTSPAADSISTGGGIICAGSLTASNVSTASVKINYSGGIGINEPYTHKKILDTKYGDPLFHDATYLYTPGNSNVSASSMYVLGVNKLGLHIPSTTQSTASTNGSIWTDGGVGIRLNTNIGGRLNVEDPTDATGTDSASVLFNGGLVVKKNLNSGGVVSSVGIVSSSGDIDTIVSDSITSSVGTIATLNATTITAPNATIDTINTTNLSTTAASFDNLTVTSMNTGTLTTSGKVSITNTSITNATPGSGSFDTLGGARIGGNLRVEQDSIFASNVQSIGRVFITNSSDSTDQAATGALEVVGGAQIGKKLIVNGNSNLKTVTSTGVTSSGRVFVSNTDETYGQGTGSFETMGGGRIEKKLSVGGSTTIDNTFDVSGPNTGALIVGGGVYIAKNVLCDATMTLPKLVSTSDEDAGQDSGAIKTAGGINAAKKIKSASVETTHVQSTTIAADNITSSTMETGNLKSTTIDAGHIKSTSIETQIIKADDTDFTNFQGLPFVYNDRPFPIYVDYKVVISGSSSTPAPDANIISQNCSIVQIGRRVTLSFDFNVSARAHPAAPSPNIYTMQIYARDGLGNRKSFPPVDSQGAEALCSRSTITQSSKALPKLGSSRIGLEDAQDGKGFRLYLRSEYLFTNDSEMYALMITDGNYYPFIIKGSITYLTTSCSMWIP